MAVSVLFDAPGPKTRVRHHLYTGLTILALVGLIVWSVIRLHSTGQFEYDKWEPFWTPKYTNALLSAWGTTISMAALSVLGAVVLGFALGIGKLADHGFIRWPCWLIVEFFRAVPVIMLMVLFFYTIFDSFSLEKGAYWSCVLGLALYNGSVLAEIVRAGINAVPKGQAEAAYAIGMRKTQVTWVILLPQAVKIMIPAIISQMVVALKDTSLILIVVGVGLTKFAKQLPQEFNNTVPTVFVAASCYIVTNLVLTGIATLIQRRFVGEKKLDVEQIAAGQDQSAAA